jgi:tight adherence protein C
MQLLFVLFAITLFLGCAAVFVLVSGRSKSASRLIEAIAPASSVTIGAPSRGFADAAATLGRAAGVIRQTFARNTTDVAERLMRAGKRRSVDTDFFYTAKVACPILGVLAAAFITGGGFASLLMFGAFGFFLPDLWLARAIAKRQSKLRHSMPDAIDLLVICMEAGLGIDQALIRVGQELRFSHPELSQEMVLIQREQRAGKPRLDAWRGMANRTGLETVQQFVNMLAQTERFGTPVARSLGHFADALRLRRIQRAEELAAKTTVKMLFPVVLLIFPSIFIVLVGPAIITLMHNLGKQFQ